MKELNFNRKSDKDLAARLDSVKHDYRVDVFDRIITAIANSQIPVRYTGLMATMIEIHGDTMS